MSWTVAIVETWSMDLEGQRELDHGEMEGYVLIRNFLQLPAPARTAAMVPVASVATGVRSHSQWKPTHPIY